MSAVSLFQPLQGDLKAANVAIKKANIFLNRGENIEDLTPTTPMAVEKLITAQMNYFANNDQNVRSRTLFHATPIGIGWILSLVARIIRVITRTLGLIISVPVALFQQSRYGNLKISEVKNNDRESQDLLFKINNFFTENVESDSKEDEEKEISSQSSRLSEPMILRHNIVAEDIRRVGQEWVDLGTTLLAAGIGVVNTVAPSAISTEFLFNYYVARIAQNEDRNNQFYLAERTYNLIKEEKHTAWKNANPQNGQ